MQDRLGASKRMPAATVPGTLRPAACYDCHTAESTVGNDAVPGAAPRDSVGCFRCIADMRIVIFWQSYGVLAFSTEVELPPNLDN